MRPFRFFFLIVILATMACGSAVSTPSASAPLIDPNPPGTEAPSAVATIPESADVTATIAPSPVNVIQVDTLEQEVYPFIENGKCSLAEAIYAANSEKPKDSCPSGVLGETVIELMPGEYHFTQRDRTPPQVEWIASVVDVGDALPPVIFPLTIHGNGAVLMRDDGSEPFRFFEVMVNARLTLENITLQGGDVQDDPGGAIYSMSALIELKNVRFVNNRAQNGGAIYFDLSALTIQNSEFTGNHASRSGGAIFISSSRATIQSTHFEANESDGDGGALHADTVTLVLTDLFFLKNRVTGDNYGSRGGGMDLNHVNLTITGSQFYRNESPGYGGAIAVNNPVLAGIDPEEGDPMEPLLDSPIVTDFLTSIPGFQATLEAHPSGIYVDFNEDAQIHNNCFANNITLNPEELNWTSGLLGRASVADGNYWGDPSGPAGMGPGTGDSVGKRLTFSPFLTAPPDFCDPDLSDQEWENLPWQS